MIFSKSDFSTVLVVGNEKGQTKSLRIKTKHINRIRHYAASICIVVLCLVLGIIYLSLEVSKIEKERIAYNRQIASLKSQIPPPKDTAQARNYIQEIETKLEKINKYLIKRGVKGFALNNVGGNPDAGADLDAEDAFALYNDRLDDILVGIAFTPLGYPANYIMNSRFGYRSDPMGRGGMEFHSGIDFKGRRGDAVKSTADGKVIMAGWFQGYGKCVRVRHKNNLETLYGHLSKVEVKVGETVTSGQIIGRVGSTGHSTGNHLHYEVRKNGRPVNPKNYLSLN